MTLYMVKKNRWKGRGFIGRTDPNRCPKSLYDGRLESYEGRFISEELHRQKLEERLHGGIY